ncbi:MAG: MBL fold metallo-hydrolase [Acidobacteria bacterium]|nr:MBL fold metallo-hydrolase [Acidobacteriota bacterium]
MQRTIHASILSVLVAFLSLAGSGAAQEAEPTRSIVNITGDLYRAQNNNHYNVFLVTSDGIVMTDPIDREFSLWLKGELARRFSVPVRYVLYSHPDWDHASGGVVFADTAEFVGHENFPAALALPGGNPPLPANAREMDANGNGLIERAEASGNTSDRFTLIDENRDQLLSGAEMIRGAVNDVYPPTTTFSDRHTVTLGGKRVVLIYTGEAHDPASAVIYFPDERTVFGADTLQAKRFPGGLGPNVGAWIEAINTVNELDYDIAATGHAMMGTKADIVALQAYLQDLAVGVAAGVASGNSLQEIQESLTLDEYRDWDRYDTQRRTHIAAVFATLQGNP